MRTSPVGRTEAGVTLIEMMVVVTLMAILTAVSFPSINSGLDTLRLNSAADSIVAFLNSGLTRAERRQQGVEVEISRADRTLTLRSTEPGFYKLLEMPEGITIAAILPIIPEEDARLPRRILLMPGGTIPRIGIELINRRGVHRIVRVDPITGVPAVEPQPS